MTPQAHIKLNSAIFEEQSARIFEPAYWQSENAVTGSEKGRGTTWFIKHNTHDLVLRHYYRGGFIRHFNRDHYIFTGVKNTRSYKEFAILESLHAQGLPVPEPAGALVRRRGLFYQADLITRRIEHAQDLLQVLQHPAREPVIDKIAETLANIHRAGVMHPDLNIQNILIDNEEKVWVIDFDQACITDLSADAKRSMIGRLKRSFEKEIVRHGIVWSSENWEQLQSAYAHYSRQ